MAIDFFAIAPEIALTVTALVVLAADLALRGEAKQLVNPLASLGTLVAIGFTVALWGQQRTTFGGTFVVNEFALVFKLVFLGSLLAILGISWRYFAEGRYFQGEYYFLLLTSFLGMLLMPSARDLILLFIALETVSVPAFVMAGLRKRDLYSSEAALKFFLIGVLSVALMLFGMSMVYGFTGTTALAGIAEAIAGDAELTPLLLASVMLIFVGFAFKISAVPFHFWAPDTYAGAPMPVAAMLAVASKAAGFAGLLVIAFVAFEPVADVWAPVLGVLAILTMTIGNLVALQQRDLVRLLAYSSVAQAGYMLIPFGLARPGGAEVNDAAVQAVVFYLVAYAVMNIGAFGVAIAVNRRTGLRSLADYAGLASRSPMLALAMTVFLLSLGGAPPTVGLWAKFAIIEAALVEVSVFGIVLMVFLAINSVIAFFYYLRIVKAMWMDTAREGLPVLQPGFQLSLVVLVLMAGTVLLGVLPGLVTDYSAVTGFLAAN
ncbi:NADH-quinone oxidoreductase subunit N [Egicoccus halophilus]|uniref:NADH-quinone oxidoreductase subunit N n=1 Tax=Egicoccus halophilus TaxID=1670830 RepID=A0A8J3AEK6_9ACTN|nr:NADH-quinone oxidoreductase subunit N [Egicoccus halophilus]GGI05768.1 NADH-quinone oxidoreductase subunit N [Egicoccus halophilus]